MSKVGLAGMSLTAALPGAILCFLMVQAAVGNISEMPPILMVAALLTLAISAMMALMPLYALLFYRPAGYVAKAKTPKAPKAPKAAKPGKGAAAPAAAAVADEAMSEDDEMVAEASELDDFEEFEEHGNELSAADADFDDDMPTGGGTQFDEEFAFDDFEEDDDKK